MRSLTGLSALTIALMAAVSAGDHLLVTDSAYRPTRPFALMGFSAVVAISESFSKSSGDHAVVIRLGPIEHRDS